jgi:hypothetical protein
VSVKKEVLIRLFNETYYILKLNIAGYTYYAREYFALRPKNVQKPPFKEFFDELKKFDHCSDETIKIHFIDQYREDKLARMIIHCEHYEGNSIEDVLRLSAAAVGLKTGLSRYDPRAEVYIDLLNGTSEDLVILLYLPRKIYNYYRKKHKDKVIQAQ